MSLRFFQMRQASCVVFRVKPPFPRRKALTGPASRPGGDGPAGATPEEGERGR